MDVLQEMIQRMSKKMNLQNSVKNTESDICPICNGTGWEFYKKDGCEYGRECKCGIRQREIMENRVSFANMPETFKDIRIDSFDIEIYKNIESQKKIKRAVEAIKYWLKEFESMKDRGMGLFLYSSEKGSGKTRMAVSIANELMYEKKQRVKFSTSMNIINEIKVSWDKKDTEYSESKLLHQLSTTDILVIDDFGTEQAKEWIGERFYQIINGRYVDKKITIFTSNYSLKYLKYDDRITDRIKERTFQLPFPEESVRNIIAKNNMIDFMKGVMQHE